jgi:mono/diheme cytochrome c family protein
MPNAGHGTGKFCFTPRTVEPISRPAIIRGMKNLRTSLLYSAFAVVAGIALSGTLPAARAAAPPDQTLIARGKYLATAGDCVACHTESGGQMFSGGEALDTPFGKIYAPNITADKKNGIGDWSDDDFYKALHEGIAKDGTYLYPAFPFPWYTKVSRQDVLAIKAYLFSLPTSDKASKPDAFGFPFNIREGLLAWRTLFFKAAEYQPDTSKSADWNRGAYLVEGLEHCGECHNKSKLVGASDWSGNLQGGVIEGWYAPSLTENAQEGIGKWSETDVAKYLKTGKAPDNGVVVGPMQETIHDSLSKLSDQDLHAIAVYIKSVPAISSEKPVKAQDNQVAMDQGGQVYLSHCAFCHLPNGQGQKGMIPSLAGDGSVTAGGPQTIISVVLGGAAAQRGYAPMPAVGLDLTDGEVAEVANYIRQAWGNRAPQNADASMVAGLRKQTTTEMALNLPEGCKPVADATLEKAVTQPGVATQLSDQGHPLVDRIDDIVGKVKSAAPKATNDQVVNALTDAYCPVVMKETSKSTVQRAADLGNFSELVYGQINRRSARN